MLHLRQFASVALCATAFIAGNAAAQSYPDKPIRLVVPYAPGGSTDIIARHISEPLSKALGQPIVVDNKAGAGGLIGTAEVARAAPDGYTLAMGTVSTMVIFPATHPKPGYSVDSFVPITNIAAMPNVLVVNPKLPANNLRELIALLKANPDKYSYASSGKGTINHMLGESFQAGAGVKIQHVPYKGSGAAMNDVMGGQVDILFDQLPSSKPHIDSGRMKLLGVIAPKRLSTYPNVMTMEEAGLKGFDDQAWYGLVAPAKTPPAVLARLSSAMKQVLSMPEVRARIEHAGAIPVGNTSAEYAAQIKSEMEKTRKLVKERNISFED
ncbi:Bug family tripartite tricarboxylate transporter substrate binding protein [Cupriavidus pauculus]|uniref:ABC transporter substrate-binding protein n=1 Tax=Cupriavidus pauculus TaxID=82633 RepID=A0A2N5C3M3_9BURK|nr:tripartite tricarboxylate transporter substrate binding protein [Cupriavidus pauculus]PLP96808.1 ABC transporter substrate-binding protein [Cupriavidus pauculus]